MDRGSDAPASQAIGGRVIAFHILAGGVSDYRYPQSDLFRLFGKEAPIPTYRNVEDLRRLVQHYLADEDERRNLVAECNKLVASGFSFMDRVRELFQIARSPRAANAARLSTW